jgi:hypothetical protein
MELEHYPGMTEACHRSHDRPGAARFDIRAARVVHRVGLLQAGEQIVLVAVTSAHRGQAFQACEFLMDYLKTQAPFWKKETTPEGARWVDAACADDAALARWGIQAGNAVTPHPPPFCVHKGTIDTRQLRHALGRFATGVTIVTCSRCRWSICRPDGQFLQFAVARPAAGAVVAARDQFHLAAFQAAAAALR